VDAIDRGAVKIIEIIGVSEKSWEDAVEMAVSKTAETVKNITGVEVTSFTAKVDGAKVKRYQAACKIAFVVS
jgi:flavin-binding protein dodecin